MPAEERVVPGIDQQHWNLYSRNKLQAAAGFPIVPGILKTVNRSRETIIELKEIPGHRAFKRDLLRKTLCLFLHFGIQRVEKPTEIEAVFPTLDLPVCARNVARDGKHYGLVNAGDALAPPLPQEFEDHIPSQTKPNENDVIVPVSLLNMTQKKIQIRGFSHVVGTYCQIGNAATPSKIHPQSVPPTPIEKTDHATDIWPFGIAFQPMQGDDQFPTPYP